MVTGENMGLAIFDNTWYCDKCNARFKNKDDFIYCPNCGNVLKNDWYQMDLQSIEKCLNKPARSICENCGEKFDIDYNFCPHCSKKLKKESILARVEKDNSIIAYWNGEEICVFDKKIFLSYPHFSGAAVRECFKWKSILDEKLESDFIEIGRLPPKKLSFKEMFSIFIGAAGGTIVNDIIKFLPYYDQDDLDEEPYNIEILEIRDDLYVKLAVERVLY